MTLQFGFGLLTYNIHSLLLSMFPYHDWGDQSKKIIPKSKNLSLTAMEIDDR